MKQYIIHGKIRERVLIIVLVFSVLLAQIIYPCIQNIAFCIEEKSSIIAGIFGTIEFLGILGNPATVMAIYGVISFAFNKYLWKTKLAFALLDVPDLNGNWEGTFESIREENGHIVKVRGKFNMVVKQTWEKMSCVCKFEMSSSESEIVYIEPLGDERYRIKFTYSNKSRDVNLNMPSYGGYNEFTLTGNHMIGDYFSGRTPPTKGCLELTRVSMNNKKQNRQ